MVLKGPKRPIFSFITIKCIEIKYLFAKNFGRYADTWTINSVLLCKNRIIAIAAMIPLKALLKSYGKFSFDKTFFRNEAGNIRDRRYF